jgi:hypothetical protein
MDTHERPIFAIDARTGRRSYPKALACAYRRRARPRVHAAQSAGLSPGLGGPGNGQASCQREEASRNEFLHRPLGNGASRVNVRLTGSVTVAVVAPRLPCGCAGSPASAARRVRSATVSFASDGDAVAQGGFGVRSWPAVGAAGCPVGPADQVGEPCVADRALGGHPVPPRVTARRRGSRGVAGPGDAHGVIV